MQAAAEREVEVRRVLGLYEPRTAHRMRREAQPRCEHCRGIGVVREQGELRGLVPDTECPCVAFCSLLPDSWRWDWVSALDYREEAVLLCQMEWIAMLGSCADLRADDLVRVLGIDDPQLRALAVRLMPLVAAPAQDT